MTTQARELAKIVNNAGDLSFIDDVALASDGAVLNFGADNDVTLTHVADTGLLINSSRQLQFGDSGTFIRQEADGVLDLTSDTEIELNATTLDINANVDISGTLTVAGDLDFGDAAISNVGALQLDSIAGDGDTNTSITFSGSDVITVATGGTTALTVDASQQVGIGETSPLATLHIKQGDSGLSSLNAAAHHLFLEDTGANGPGITLASGTTSNCSLVFGDSDSNYQAFILYDNSADAMKFGTNGGTERMRIDSSGRVGINRTPAVSNSKLEVGGADNVPLINVEASGETAGIGIGNTALKFYYGTSEKLRLLDSGGITFNGDSATANALDDYEEGTFNPSTSISGASGAIAFKSGGDTLSYTKIGDMVHIQGKLEVNTNTAPGGRLNLGNLPFTSLDLADGSGASIFTCQISGGSGSQASGYFTSIGEGATLLQIQTYTGVGTSNDSAVTMAANSVLFIQGQYKAS
tara:strand:- start:77 stop:1480 length:1404 start_codon:yes stop_codon:yes gene_type:complete